MNKGRSRRSKRTPSTIATARSLQEHLNTPQGALYGFAMRPPRSGPLKAPVQVATSIEGLWLASSYAGSGGYSGSMGSGAAAARAALKADAVTQSGSSLAGTALVS